MTCAYSKKGPCIELYRLASFVRIKLDKAVLTHVVLFAGGVPLNACAKLNSGLRSQSDHSGIKVPHPGYDQYTRSASLAIVMVTIGSTPSGYVAQAAVRPCRSSSICTNPKVKGSAARVTGMRTRTTVCPWMVRWRLKVASGS